ncbi:MAG: aminodeoxychorismate/anthranilate synthase component II [Peptostreptococcaceae bacterium]
MILMIDNYDSFVYNVVRYIKELGEEVLVYRNNEIDIYEIEKLNPEIIILSPGPCTPKESGVCIDIIKHFKGIIPIFGICLGHQTIADVFGCDVIKAKNPVHGKVYEITHDNKGIFKYIKNPLNVTRYHSLIVENVSDEITITSRTLDGEIMGIRHNKYMIEGVQFHPEAILSECGHDLLSNFIKMARGEICD